jgi:hypothetical protein
MSIPLDRLYHYIQDVANQIRNGYVLIYRFTPHGSKNIEDLLCPDKSVPLISCEYPQLYCNDQEPLDYDFYQKSTYSIVDELRDKMSGFNLRIHPYNIYDKCLLLHSEKNSIEVQKYKDSHFIPVYYWAHAIIAQDWFRYAKDVNIKPNSAQKQFLIYNRAWGGTREYRLKFVELLQQNNLVNKCQSSFNPIEPAQNIHFSEHVFNNPLFKPANNLQDIFPITTASSHASADFIIDDYAGTKIEVVLETLFDDDRIQLTEKILRPIACGHPFILASSAGSLEYLRNYGFKTFDGIIDESYDDELDPVARLNLIIKSMKDITQWSEEEQINNWKKIKEITAYNKKHFFSDVFFNSIVEELTCNLKQGLTELEETNTSKDYLLLRKKFFTPLKFSVYYKQLRSTNKTTMIHILLKARGYYNRYLKSLK